MERKLKFFCHKLSSIFCMYPTIIRHNLEEKKKMRTGIRTLMMAGAVVCLLLIAYADEGTASFYKSPYLREYKYFYRDTYRIFEPKYIINDHYP